MNLETDSLEELREMSLIDFAHELFLLNKQAVTFKELLAEITERLQLTDDEIRARISQFYTDMNIDGRFLCVGDNKWGLRAWYPFTQFEDESLSLSTPKPKKKKSKKKDDDEDDFDDLDLTEDEFDDLDDDFVDTDDDDDDDDDNELDGFIEEVDLDAEIDEDVELEEDIEEELEIEPEEDEDLVEEEE